MILHIDDTKKYLVIDRCTQTEYDQLTISYQKYAKNYRFHPKFKSGLWDGKINFIKGQYIPATTYKYLFDLCNEYNFDFCYDLIKYYFTFKYEFTINNLCLFNSTSSSSVISYFLKI